MINRHDSNGEMVDPGEFNQRQAAILREWSALRQAEEYDEDPNEAVGAWCELFAGHVRDLCDIYSVPVDEVFRRQKEFQEQIEHDLELQRWFTGLGWEQAAKRIQHELQEVKRDDQVIGYRMTFTFPSVDGVGSSAVREVFFPIDTTDKIHIREVQ